MKKVLGLVGSDRKLGNSEIMIKEIFKNIREDCALSLIRLFRLDLISCKGCYACLQPEVDCNIEDDYNFVLDEMTRARQLFPQVREFFFDDDTFTARLYRCGSDSTFR